MPQFTDLLHTSPTYPTGSSPQYPMSQSPYVSPYEMARRPQSTAAPPIINYGQGPSTVQYGSMALMQPTALSPLAPASPTPPALPMMFPQQAPGISTMVPPGYGQGLAAALGPMAQMQSGNAPIAEILSRLLGYGPSMSRGPGFNLFSGGGRVPGLTRYSIPGYADDQGFGGLFA